MFCLGLWICLLLSLLMPRCANLVLLFTSCMLLRISICRFHITHCTACSCSYWPITCPKGHALASNTCTIIVPSDTDDNMEGQLHHSAADRRRLAPAAHVKFARHSWGIILISITVLLWTTSSFLASVR